MESHQTAVSYNNFIGIFKELFPLGFCEELIDQIDQLDKKNYTRSRHNPYSNERSLNHIMQDKSIDLNHSNVNSTMLMKNEQVNLLDIFYKGLKFGLETYLQKYSILQNNNLSSFVIKAQITGKSEGYHVWHYEQGFEPGLCYRQLVWMFYLNNLYDQDGGETEFLYQSLRFKPTKNTLLIWPADFTHTHRGNTVLGDQKKYVLTGWFLSHK